MTLLLSIRTYVRESLRAGFPLLRWIDSVLTWFGYLVAVGLAIAAEKLGLEVTPTNNLVFLVALFAAIWTLVVFAFVAPFRLWRAQRIEINRLRVEIERMNLEKVAAQKTFVVTLTRLRSRLVMTRNIKVSDDNYDEWSGGVDALRGEIVGCIEKHLGGPRAHLYKIIGNVEVELTPGEFNRQGYRKRKVILTRDIDYIGNLIVESGT